MAGYIAPADVFHAFFQSYVAMDDNSGFTCCGLWRQLEIHSQSFKLVVSLYVEGEETKNVRI